MDISKLPYGAKLVPAGAVLFLIVSIFNWQEVDFGGIASAGVSMWHGWGVLAGLVAIGLIVWEGLRIANIKVEFGLSPTMVSAGLSVLLILFTFLKFVADNEFRTFWAWLGLILAILIVLAAFANMRSGGESLSDMRSSVAAAASSAAGAVKAAAESTTEKAGGAAEAAPPSTPDVAAEGGDEPTQSA